MLSVVANCRQCVTIFDDMHTNTHVLSCDHQSTNFIVAYMCRFFELADNLHRTSQQP